MIASIANGEIVVDANARYTPVLQKIPGGRYDRTKGWVVPLTWTSCLCLRDALGTELEIAPDLNQWAAEASKPDASELKEYLSSKPHQNVGTSLQGSKPAS